MKLSYLRPIWLFQVLFLIFVRQDWSSAHSQGNYPTMEAQICCVPYTQCPRNLEVSSPTGRNKLFWVSGTITIRPFKRFLPGRQVVSSQACAVEHSTEYLSVPLPVCKAPSLYNSLLLCSDLQIGATLVTLAYLGLLLPSCLGTPPIISWDSYKTQPVWFPSLRDLCPSWSEVQCLSSGCHNKIP